MAELADAHGSGPCTRKGVKVRVLSSAPKNGRCGFAVGEPGLSDRDDSNAKAIPLSEKLSDQLCLANQRASPRFSRLGETSKGTGADHDLPILVRRAFLKSESSYGPSHHGEQVQIRAWPSILQRPRRIRRPTTTTSFGSASWPDRPLPQHLTHPAAWGCAPRLTAASVESLGPAWCCRASSSAHRQNFPLGNLGAVPYTAPSLFWEQAPGSPMSHE